MVRTIVKGKKIFRVAEKATRADIQIAKDLADTLKENQERCVGMAANMIGENKRIIAFQFGPMIMTMFNPKITDRSGKYLTEEGCLSLEGKRNCTRFETIEVEFEDIFFKKRKEKFTGFTAEIIQHEIDHLEGIII
ncbi:MAG: peptide deformylase [Sphaerochaetaceae bacterium]|nr:peptide deformylase [Sphaerochaetaceae bacterium]